MLETAWKIDCFNVFYMLVLEYCPGGGMADATDLKSVFLASSIL